MRLLLLVFAACNPLLGLDEPTLVDADPSFPSCETGWRFHQTITIQNEVGELHDYQVAVRVDLADALRNGRLLPDASDLRFTSNGSLLAHAIDGQLGASTLIWVSVPVVPHGTSTLDLHYANPLARPLTTSPFLDVIANASFESTGGWTIQPAKGPPGAFVLQSPAWFSQGAGSLLVDEHVSGERAEFSQSSISQTVAFPSGSDYVIRFDINVLAASSGGINGADNGTFLITDGNGIDNIYVLSGDQGNITGIHLGEETFPIGAGTVPITIVVRVAYGTDAGYAKGFIDNLRVRKHVTPEPTTIVGLEEQCFTGT